MTRDFQLIAGPKRFDIFDREFLSVLTVISVSLIVFSVVFWNEASNAIRVAVESPTFSYCVLVLPLCFFLIWRRRSEIRGCVFAPDLRGAIVILALSLLWLVISAIGVLEIQQFVVVSIVQAALFACMGAAIYRALLAPLLYLYFLVPTGTFLIPELQSITARFAVFGLHLLRIPVFSNGAVIELPVGTFAVAEACAGVRFLIAAFAFGVFYAVLTYRSFPRRIGFVALSLVVPVVANGLRVLGLLAAAEWLGSATAVLADHILYGWLFFSFVLVLLILIGRMFADSDVEDQREGAKSNGIYMWSADARRITLVAATCFIAGASGPITASLLSVPPILDLPSSGPDVGTPWRRVATANDWSPVVVGPARTFAETFTDGSNTVDRFVALYGLHGSKSSFIRTTNRAADEHNWSFNSQSDAKLSVSGKVFPAHMTVWLRGQQQRVVWSFYVVNGIPVSGMWAAKWQDFYAYVRSSRCVSAYMALSVEGTVGSVSSVSVQSFLTSSQPLGAYLCAPSSGSR